tara:strand:- start:1197 stop:1448 length:252 start_codon:yes stop_codon:yes gene_type:complete
MQLQIEQMNRVMMWMAADAEMNKRIIASQQKSIMKLESELQKMKDDTTKLEIELREMKADKTKAQETEGVRNDSWSRALAAFL